LRSPRVGVLTCQCRCYLYRLVRSWFAQTKHLAAHDPFFTQKQDTFQHSSKAVYGPSACERIWDPT
jgi:hypothetical protein